MGNEAQSAFHTACRSASAASGEDCTGHLGSESGALGKPRPMAEANAAAAPNVSPDSPRCNACAGCAGCTGCAGCAGCAGCTGSRGGACRACRAWPRPPRSTGTDVARRGSASDLGAEGAAGAAGATGAAGGERGENAGAEAGEGGKGGGGVSALLAFALSCRSPLLTETSDALAVARTLARKFRSRSLCSSLSRRCSRCATTEHAEWVRRGIWSLPFGALLLSTGLGSCQLVSLLWQQLKLQAI